MFEDGLIKNVNIFLCSFYIISLIYIEIYKKIEIERVKNKDTEKINNIYAMFRFMRKIVFVIFISLESALIVIELIELIK